MEQEESSEPSIDRIRRLPTTLRAQIDVGGGMQQLQDTHESVLSAYQILERVKWLLHEGSSPAVVLREIAEMEGES